MPPTQLCTENENAQAILNFLRNRAAHNALPPTRQEIRDGTKIASTGTVQRWIKRLEKEGFIRVEPEKARAITLTSRGRG